MFAVGSGDAVVGGAQDDPGDEQVRAMQTLNRLAAYGEGESARIGNRFLSYLFALARLQSETELAETRKVVPPAKGRSGN